jgi:hypothetical protein
MQPNWRVSLGAGRAKTDAGTIVGATAAAAAALRKFLRFMLASRTECITHASPLSTPPFPR